MRHERRLHLGRRHIDAAHLEHVVGAAAVDVIAVLVDAVLVAAARPRTLEGVLRFLALVPVHDRGGRAADLQLAQLARLGDDAALIVDKAKPVAGYRLPRAARTYVAGTVGKEDVQHLGGADAIQQLGTGALGPALEDFWGKRFAGG